MLGIAMAYMNKYQSDDYRRDELIRIIEHSVEKLTLQSWKLYTMI